MRSINMRIISENIQYCTVVMLFIFSNILSQEIGSPWIEVKGRYPECVNVNIKEGTRIIYLYSSKVIDEVAKTIEIDETRELIKYLNK